jgi:hypothetical protein
VGARCGFVTGELGGLAARDVIRKSPGISKFVLDESELYVESSLSMSLVFIPSCRAVSNFLHT